MVLPLFKSHLAVGKRVIVRVDFNVPLTEDGMISDDFRIMRTLPLLRDVVKRAGHVVLLSHLTEKKEHRSFDVLIKELKRVTGFDIVLAYTVTEALAFEKANPKHVVLLENLRSFPGEMDNSEAFADDLATLADIYINEDFSQSHRPYASIVTLPHRIPSYAGPLFNEEVTKLKEVFEPARPFMVIMGGVKFKTKVNVLDQFIEKADLIFIGGALANTFLAAAGHSTGASPIETDAIPDIQKKYLNKNNIVFPCDVEVDSHEIVSLDGVDDDDFIYDIGPDTLSYLKEQVNAMGMVLWNGPLGFVEKGFSKGTEDLLTVLLACKAHVIIGGGDTIAILRGHDWENKFYHVSTGGGAMLEFLATGTLPGITALEK